METAVLSRRTGYVCCVFEGSPKRMDDPTPEPFVTPRDDSFFLVPVLEPEIPANKRAVGRATYSYNGKVVEKYVRLTDWPPLPAEKKLERFLEVADLTVDELKSVLGVS